MILSTSVMIHSDDVIQASHTTDRDGLHLVIRPVLDFDSNDDDDIPDDEPVDRHMCSANIFIHDARQARVMANALLDWANWVDTP